MKIGIAGLGLIGGSLAKALSSRTAYDVYGWNRTERTVKEAVDSGALSGPLTDVVLGECDAVFIALYPDSAISWLQKNASKICNDAIVMDTCGVKQPVCPQCFDIAGEHGFTFIGSHPMAGIEHSGFSHSTASMFDSASMILVPPAGVEQSKLDRAKQIANDIGFGRIVVTTAEEHDMMIAYTSQLAHVVSSAYVLSPCSMRHEGFSAGSYRDMTRVACLNEDMWTELFMENAAPLCKELQGLIDRLTKYRDAIEGRDEELVRSMLRDGRLRKEKADGKTLR